MPHSQQTVVIDRLTKARDPSLIIIMNFFKLSLQLKMVNNHSVTHNAH